MIKVESLQYDTIFKKAFRNVEIFTGLVEDFTGIHLEIDEVENDKVFAPPIGRVRARFDLFAEDKKNRIIVEAQHASNQDDFDRFFYYHVIAMAETIHSSKNYNFPKIVITMVFFSDRKSPSPDNNILIQDLEIRNLKGKVIENMRELKHQIIFVFTEDPLGDISISEQCQEWIRAIDDTLDGAADEDDYESSLIKQLFQVISKDKTTPEEYAQMKEEYNQRLAVKEAFENGKKLAVKEAFESKKETAHNLKAFGTLTDEQIADATGLSLEIVKVL